MSEQPCPASEKRGTLGQGWRPFPGVYPQLTCQSLHLQVHHLYSPLTHCRRSHPLHLCTSRPSSVMTPCTHALKNPTKPTLCTDHLPFSPSTFCCSISFAVHYSPRAKVSMHLALPSCASRAARRKPSPCSYVTELRAHFSSSRWFSWKIVNQWRFTRHDCLQVGSLFLKNLSSIAGKGLGSDNLAQLLDVSATLQTWKES